MRAGSLRHLATFYAPSSTPNSLGEFPLVEVGRYRCNLKQKYTIERAENGETFSKVRYDIMSRWNQDLASLSATAEVQIDGERLQILTVADPTGRHKDLWITAEKRE